MPIALGTPLLVALLLSSVGARASERRITAPGGALTVVVSDGGGLHFRVEAGGQPVVIDSPLGLVFQGGAKLGPAAVITKSTTAAHDGSWENRFGNRRVVRDSWRELRVTLKERGRPARTFGLVARAYDDGIAFRYDLPKASGLGSFVLAEELTELHFAANHRCWAGGQSSCAEAPYRETTLSAIPRAEGDRPFQSVLPLLVETPAGYLAVAESDLLDWAGMSLTGTGTAAVKVTLDRRTDGNGLVVSTVPRISPWRVLMFGRTAAELAGSDLVATLATPSRLADVSWIRPGASAWDAWWTGINSHDPDPKHTGSAARGNTASHKEYIDLAAEMGWPYQVVDWFWYTNMTSYDRPLFSKPDPTRPQADLGHPVAGIDLPELVRYAKSKNVRLLLWAHSLDLDNFGVERALASFAAQGFAGVKIDFINSQSQEAVRWCEKVLEVAAKHQLLVDFHGMYKPTGLARTYPNFITQEGVLGNEYNKFDGNQCSIGHTVTLPFTRALLGPMDFTPGGFLNHAPATFKSGAFPAEVPGSRARQLAMTVIYPSPLLVLCDSPKNYRGQPGIDFLRAIPTVWDESVVVSGAVGRSIVVARRAGERWYLAALNGDGSGDRGGDAATELRAPLAFLRDGAWTLHAFADDTTGSNYRAVVESTRQVDASSELPLSLLPGGGFVAIATRATPRP